MDALRRDFEDRCAYSMQHSDNAGGVEQMEVDHFDPRQKKDYLQRYENLFLVKRACNNKKRENWPTAAEQALGIRFLNPCEEMDYGEHIFEDPVTHEVWSDTPAGRYHIRTIGLNSANLIQERADRAELYDLLAVRPKAFRKPADDRMLDYIRALRLILERAIPLVPFKQRQKTPSSP